MSAPVSAVSAQVSSAAKLGLSSSQRPMSCSTKAAAVSARSEEHQLRSSRIYAFKWHVDIHKSCMGVQEHCKIKSRVVQNRTSSPSRCLHWIAWGMNCRKSFTFFIHCPDIESIWTHQPKQNRVATNGIRQRCNLFRKCVIFIQQPMASVFQTGSIMAGKWGVTQMKNNSTQFEMIHGNVAIVTVETWYQNPVSTCDVLEAFGVR